MKHQSSLRSGRVKKIGRGLILFFGLILLLMALAPSLLSSTPLTRLILSKVNARLDGTLAVADLSLGWRSGVTMVDVRFADEADRIQLRCKRLSARPTWTALWRGDVVLNESLLEEPLLRIDLGAVGPGPRFGGQESGPLGPETPQAGETPKPSSPPWVPRMDLTIRAGRVELVGGQRPPVTLARVQTRLSVPGGGKPSRLSFGAEVVVGGEPGSVGGDLTVQQEVGNGWKAEGIVAEANLTADDVDLDVLSGLFDLIGLDLRTAGRLDGSLQGHLKGKRIERLSLDIGGRQVEVTGSALNGDHLASQAVTLRAQLGQEENTLKVASAALSGDWFSADLQGAIVLDETGEPNLADSLLEGTYTLDMAGLLGQLPGTLDLREGVNVTTGDSSGRMTLDQGRLVADLDCKGLAGTVGAKSVTLAEPLRMHAALTLVGASPGLDRLTLGSAFTDLELVRQADRINLNHWLDLGQFQTELGPILNRGTMALQGTVWTNAVVLPVAGRYAVEGTSIAEGLSVSSSGADTLTEPKIELAYSLDLLPRERQLALNRLSLHSGFGQAELSDSRIGLSPVAARLQGTFQDFDLDRLCRLASACGVSPPQGLALAGSVLGTIECQWRNGLFELISSQTEIRNARMQVDGGDSLIPESMTLAAAGTLDTRARRLELSRLSFLSPQLDVSHARLLKEDLGGETVLSGTAEYRVDLDASAALLTRVLPEGLSLSGVHENHLTFSTRYPLGAQEQMLPAASARGTFGFDHASYQGLHFAPVDVNYVLAGGVLEIQPFTTQVNEGQCRFAGRCDLREARPVLRLTDPLRLAQDIHLTEEVTESLLKYVNPIFADLSGVRGRATLDCRSLAIPFDGNAVDLLEMDATLSLRDVVLQGSSLLNQILAGLNQPDLRAQSITLNPTRILVRDGRVTYEDMPLLLGDNPLNFSGTIGLDERLNLDILLPYTLDGRTARAETPRGERVTAALGGTLSRPKLEMKGLVDQLLQIGIRRGLGELLKRQ